MDKDVLKKVSVLALEGCNLDCYGSVDDPKFKAVDLVRAFGIDDIFACCEIDEYETRLYDNDYSTVPATFVNEVGLYNILSRSDVPKARHWRRIMQMQLVALRKQRGFDVVQQFEEWDGLIGEYFYDDQRDVVYKSVLLPGGDVEEVEVE